MKYRERFSDQRNRNCFDPVLARPDWKCSSVENLECLNFAANKLIKQSRVVRDFLTVCSYRITSTF